MKALEERILRDGHVRPGNILKVDSFLNHQIDISFMNEMGKEFRRVFARDHRNYDRRRSDLPGAELKLPASVLHQSNRIILPIGVTERKRSADAVL